MENIDLDPSFGISYDSPRGELVANRNSAAAHAMREAKRHARTARRAEELDKLLGDIRPGESWHVISTGNIDAGSYLHVLISRYGPFEHAYISTWRISREYINRLRGYLETGQLGGFTLFTGDYFAARYPADYTLVCDLADQYNGRVYRWQNHAKMVALRNSATGWTCVMATSSNMTENPRTEQAAIVADQDLYNFYKNWFEETANGREQYRLSD